MTDQQLLTLALAVIIPLSLLLYSNSRITDVKQTLGNSIAEAKETLRADMQSLRSELRSEMIVNKSEIIAAIRGLDAKLMIHELEHHHK